MPAQRLSLLLILLPLVAACGNSTPLATTDHPVPDPVEELPEVFTDPVAGAWLEGDLHVHDDHSSDGSLPRQISGDQLPGNVSIADQIFISELRGLDFLPLTDHRTYDQHYDPLWRSEQLILIPGEEANGRPHATVHGAVDTIVQGADVPHSPERRKLQQSIWDAHAQGAAWCTAHPDDGEFDDGVPNDFADAVGIDCVEVWNKASNAETELDYAENRWNAGFRFGVAGGSDDHFKELWLLAGPGQPRSGIHAAAASERGIVRALRAGRTRVRADDLAAAVELSADYGERHALGGDEIVAPAGTAITLRIAVSQALGDTVRVFKSPGRTAGPLAEFPVGLVAGEQSWTLPVEAEAEPSWYRVEVRGLGLPATINYSALTDDPLQFVLDNQVSVIDQLRGLSAPIFVSTAPVEARPAAPLPPDIGVDDGASLVLGERGTFAGFPDIAVAGGAVHVVAEQHALAGAAVMYSHRDAAGMLSEPIVLSADSISARFPRVAARGSSVWVVWQDESRGEVPRRPGIVLRRSEDGGVHWHEPQALREIDGRAEHPAIALTADGLPVVAWQEIRHDSAFDIHVQIIGRDTEPLNLSGEDKPVAAASLLDTRTARYPASVWPALAVAPSGAIAVAWQDNRDDADPLWTGQSISGEGTDPDDWQIQVRVRESAAADWSAATTLGAADRADRHPALAYSARGRLVAAWDSKPLESSGVNLNLQSASTDDGFTWTEPTAVFEQIDAMSQWPRLGRDPDGRVRIAWYDSRSSDWRWRVGTAVLTTGGNWEGFKLLPGRGNNTWPALDQGYIAFATTRSARRLQRDPTQQIAIVVD
jgi:hypothetical protein